MAGFIGYRKNTWDNATAAQRGFLSTIIDALQLGDPVLYDNGSGIEWYVFHDSRIGPRFVENLGWASQQISNITNSPDRSYPVAEGDDVLSEAASANSPGTWFAAATSIPVGWSPVTPDEVV